MRVQSLGREDPLEEGRATHSSILGGESHGQRSLVELQRVRHDCSDLARTHSLRQMTSPLSVLLAPS